MVKQVADLFSDVYRGKKVLVTGDTGFKGSWLSIWLKHLGAEVYGFALPPRTKDDNFVRCGLNEIVHHRDGDIRDSAALLKFAKEVKPDIAFHLAAQALVLDSYKNPSETFETNVMGTVRFFEMVRSVPSIKAALNVTSDKCYQNNEWVWGYRENDPMGGSDPYSASKGAAEIITSSYLTSFFRSENECSVASVRAGNVIGGGDWADHRIIPDFFRAVRQNKPLVIRHPLAIRPWQFVLEPLRGYLMLGQKLFDNGKAYSGGWNFGPPASGTLPVKKIIEAMILHLKQGSYECPESSSVVHETLNLRLDISKAFTYLGWHPVLDLDETIRCTVAGYESEFGKDVNVMACRIKQIIDYTDRLHR